MNVIREVKFIDAKKKASPSKHYVYLIAVTFEDGTTNMIWRRYSQFFDLQCSLLDKFPNEAGEGKDKRTLPQLPGKIIFGRSHVREVAMKRLSPLEQYCNDLINQPSHISQCNEVVEFFRLSKDDISHKIEKPQTSSVKAKSISTPLQIQTFIVKNDYQARERNQLSVKKGMTVEAIEINDSGWWFVRLDDKTGWLPGNFLQELSLKTNSEGKYSGSYIATENYTAKDSNELSFLRGNILEILDKNKSGWWKARFKNKVGLVPGVYLKKHIQTPVAPQPSQSTYQTEESISRQQSETEPEGDQQEFTYKKCRVTADFTPDSTQEGCIELKEGQEAEVLEEDESGYWWYLSIGEEKGWALASHLEIIQADPTENIYEELELYQDYIPQHETESSNLQAETEHNELNRHEDFSHKASEEQAVEQSQRSRKPASSISERIKRFEMMNS